VKRQKTSVPFQYEAQSLGYPFISFVIVHIVKQSNQYQEGSVGYKSTNAYYKGVKLSENKNDAAKKIHWAGYDENPRHWEKKVPSNVPDER